MYACIEQLNLADSDAFDSSRKKTNSAGFFFILSLNSVGLDLKGVGRREKNKFPQSPYFTMWI